MDTKTCPPHDTSYDETQTLSQFLAEMEAPLVHAIVGHQQPAWTPFLNIMEHLTGRAASAVAKPMRIDASTLYSDVLMPNRTRADLLRVVAARALDLRAEFEAQLRAVGRVEEQVRRLNTATDNRLDRLDEVLQRDLTAMLTNNRNIRTVLDDLVKDVGMPIARE